MYQFKLNTSTFHPTQAQDCFRASSNNNSVLIMLYLYMKNWDKLLKNSLKTIPCSSSILNHSTMAAQGPPGGIQCLESATLMLHPKYVKGQQRVMLRISRATRTLFASQNLYNVFAFQV